MITPKVADDGRRLEKKRKRNSSPRTTWIKFYHENNTEEAKVARTDRASHQLLVHGLSRTPQGRRPPTAGPQEIQLNNLMAELSTDSLNADGVNVTQDNIVGANLLEPSPGEKTQITRITLDSRHTKACIRRAAEKSDRWGGGTHPIFFRDITLDQRKRKTLEIRGHEYAQERKNCRHPQKGG